MNKDNEWNKVVQKRLRNMAEMATERRERLFSDREPKNPNWYVRICGNSYRAVSLYEDSPLMGFVKNNAKKFDTILNHFEKGEPGKINNGEKPERRLQCWLIKQSLQNKLSLKTALSLDNKKYDDLLFALDEVSLGDRNHTPIIRCDILAVGIQNGNAFPVLIELKSNRAKEELVNQIDDFVDHINNLSKEFEELLSRCVNKPVRVSRKIGKMIIWPTAGKAGRESIDHFIDNKKIDVIEYHWDHKSDINSINFSAYYS